MILNRRRFLAISAAAIGTTATAAAGYDLHWTGTALGARASIRLSHPQAADIAARAAAEIARLERVFSLFQPASALSRLNATGRLDAPPPELLECLTMADAVHRASRGRFDPSVQPLWALWAASARVGKRPAALEIAAARSLGRWGDLRLQPDAITMPAGMALTLNGIAQGYIADCVARLLAAEGLTDILIDTGEHRAVGGLPDGGDWPVTLRQGGQVGLRDRALASSAPLGTVLDPAGRFGHILDPRRGEPALPVWRAITVSAPSAALADALSTAGCLTANRDALDALVTAFPDARCESAV